MIALILPKPQDHLRRGEARPAKAGRAARERVGRYNSKARQRAVLVAYAERWNAALAQTGCLTAAHYLRNQLKAAAAFVASFASPYGKAVRQAHIDLFGTEPESRGLMVIGNRRPRLIPIFSYSEDKHEALALGAATYARTAVMIGA
jgi:hypothetical protein